ncbi:MAG: Hsp70 family protein, partial [Acidimicrobiales bacterium]
TDAASNFLPIGATVRDQDFSGDKVDQGILDHLLSRFDDGNTDPAGTAAVGSLTRLRTECRHAKERLSTDAATVVPVDLPGFSGNVRLNRADLENVASGPLDGFLAVLLETLESNRIPSADLAAVATVGGGASIPIITERLSQRLGAPVIATPQPALSAAVGAAVLAEQRPPADTATNLAAAADVPTGMAPSAWAAGATVAAKDQSAADGAKSATFRALAWSQDDSAADEPVPYSGTDYASGYGQGDTGARPAAEFETVDDDRAVEPEPLAWYRRPAVLFGLAAAFVLLAGGGLAYALTASNGTPTDTPQAPVTVTVTGSNGSPTVSVITPPPPSTTTNTSTTTQPTTTTTSSSTTTTTQPSTTTQQPTTTTAEKTTKTPTTTAEPSTTAAKPSTTAASPSP